MKSDVNGEMDEKSIENERVEAKENRLDPSEYAKLLMENVNGFCHNKDMGESGTDGAECSRKEGCRCHQVPG